MSAFMHWLTTVHAMQWHKLHGTAGTGAVYQSRFVSVGISDGVHYLTALRYVERNPIAANLVKRAEDWRWSSAAHLHNPDHWPLDEGPLARPANWLDFLAAEDAAAE